MTGVMRTDGISMMRGLSAKVSVLGMTFEELDSQGHEVFARDQLARCKLGLPWVKVCAAPMMRLA